MFPMWSNYSALWYLDMPLYGTSSNNVVIKFAVYSTGVIKIAIIKELKLI